jgi:hypothetical protein
MPFFQNKIPITLSVTLSVTHSFFCRERFDKIRWGKKESVVLLTIGKFHIKMLYILRGPLKVLATQFSKLNINAATNEFVELNKSTI